MPSDLFTPPNVLSNSSNITITSCSISSIKLASPGIYVSTIITGNPFFTASTARILENKDLPIPLAPDKITPRFLLKFGKAFNTLFTFSMCTPYILSSLISISACFSK